MRRVHPCEGDASDKAESDAGSHSDASSGTRWRRAVAIGLSQAWKLERAERRKLVLDPDAPSGHAWNCVHVLALCFNAFTVPFRAAFFPPPTGAGVVDALWAIGFVCDFVYAGDMLVSLHRGFEEQGHKELNRRRIRRRYLRTLVSFTHATFALDVLSVVPIDLIELRVPGLRGLLRLNRLLRAHRMFATLSELGERARLGHHATLVAGLLVHFAFFVHFVGCVWFAAGEAHGFGADSWVPPAWLGEAPLGTQYLGSLNRALGMMSGVLAVGDPTNGTQVRMADVAPTAWHCSRAPCSRTRISADR